MARFANKDHQVRIQVKQLLVPGMTVELAMERIKSLRLQVDNQGQDSEPLSFNVVNGALRAARRRQSHGDRLADVVSDFERSALASDQPTTKLYKDIARKRQKHNDDEQLAIRQAA